MIFPMISPWGQPIGFGAALRSPFSFMATWAMFSPTCAVVKAAVKLWIHVTDQTYCWGTLWLFHIAMEDLYKWRFVAGKIIYKWAMFHSYVK